MAQPETEGSYHFGVAKFEQRAHPRFLLNLPVEYYPAKSNTRRTGYTENASKWGLIVHLRNRFKVGDMLKLRLFFSSGPGINTVETLSRVIWTEKLKDAEFRCGMKFVEISPEDMDKLSSFLRKFSPLSH